MKQCLLLLALSFLTSLAFAETRDYKKTGPMTAQVVITTDTKDSIQAASYIDGLEIKKFIAELLVDPDSSLAIAKKEIEIENCGEEASPANNNLANCGKVMATGFVQTSFGRGGWMECGASYTFFLGFQSTGSGRFFEATRMAQIREEVSAHVDENLNYTGQLTKSLSLENIETINGHLN